MYFTHHAWVTWKLHYSDYIYHSVSYWQKKFFLDIKKNLPANTVNIKNAYFTSTTEKRLEISGTKQQV